MHLGSATRSQHRNQHCEKFAAFVVYDNCGGLIMKIFVLHCIFTRLSHRPQFSLIKPQKFSLFVVETVYAFQVEKIEKKALGLATHK